MRKPRILRDGAKYHVIAKINRGEFIFKDDCFKDLFLELIKRAKKKYSFSISNFIIMTNHIHLFMRAFISKMITIFNYL